MIATQQQQQQQQAADATMLADALPIFINGCEKLASGLTKRTTVDDVKYAMLTVSDPHFAADQDMDAYGIFEQWQGNERLLDAKLKIYKLIRTWQSLPGQQLDQVKFVIKRKRVVHHHQHHHQQQQQHQQQEPKVARIAKLAAPLVASEPSQQTPCKQAPKSPQRFAFCTLSPATDKSWNVRQKSSYIQRELAAAARHRSPSSSNEECENTSRRYASIKRFNAAACKSSSVKKSALIELVNKQNDIIATQLTRIASLDEQHEQENQQQQQTVANKKSSTSSFINKCLSIGKQRLNRCKSNDVCRYKRIDADESSNMEQMDARDVSAAIGFEPSTEFETIEYARLCADYVKADARLSGQLRRADHLQAELRATRKLARSEDKARLQHAELSELDGELARFDDIISLKTKFIESLESELKRLELHQTETADNEMSVPATLPRSLAHTPSSATSSTSSTSSVFTSVSAISESQASKYNYKQSQAQHAVSALRMDTFASANVSSNSSSSSAGGDNESDTGISSANSDDLSNSHLETLV